jgi:NitT/TauT family transport system substrate-binding protein
MLKDYPMAYPSFSNSGFMSKCRSVIGICALMVSTPSLALDHITFGTNWLAEAEHGGFYQAVVDGTYEKYGLDVKIIPGGPQSNNRLLLATGKLDFNMGANLIQAFTAVEQNIPTVAVASMFQKDPYILMSHPQAGFDHWSDLPKATAFIGKENLTSVFQWLKLTYGFQEEKVKPYTFNPAPFIADKNSIQQGYLTSEPHEVEQQGGFKPNIFLLADYGYDSYSTTIETRRETIEKNPDLVQRFVNASIIGWYHYMYGDHAKADEAIKKDNPDMRDDQIAFSIARMKEYGIVDSGDSLTLGIGAMTDARMKSFFDKMVKSAVIKSDLDYHAAYDLRFINKGIGLELRPKSEHN